MTRFLMNGLFKISHILGLSLGFINSIFPISYTLEISKTYIILPISSLNYFE